MPTTTIILQNNSPEIRKKIEDAGIKCCICCSFKDAGWLDYNPGITKQVHGVGYYDGELDFIKSKQQAYAFFLSECEDPLFCKDVDEFIETIKRYESYGDSTGNM